MKALLFISILGVQLLAHATGGIEGGDGKGVVCTDTGNNVISVELLDLWEARTLFKQMPDTNLVAGGVATGVGNILALLKQSYPFEGSATKQGQTICVGQDCLMMDLKDNASLFLNPSEARVVRLHGVKLQLTDDSYEVAQPDGNCDIRQIVNYGLGADSQIYIDQDLFDKMDALNQAALIAHESYYSFLRDYANETNSIRTRRAIGYAVSNKGFTSVLPLTVPENALVCADSFVPGVMPQTRVYFYPDSANKVGYKMYIESFGGTPLIGMGSGETTLSNSANFNPGTDRTCAGNSILSGLTDVLSGPVEYDQEFSIRWNCNNGQVVGWVNQHQAGSTQSTTQLECHTTQKAFSVPEM